MKNKISEFDFRLNGHTYYIKIFDGVIINKEIYNDSIDDKDRNVYILKKEHEDNVVEKDQIYISIYRNKKDIGITIFARYSTLSFVETIFIKRLYDAYIFMNENDDDIERFNAAIEVDKLFVIYQLFKFIIWTSKEYKPMLKTFILSKYVEIFNITKKGYIPKPLINVNGDLAYNEEFQKKYLDDLLGNRFVIYRDPDPNKCCDAEVISCVYFDIIDKELKIDGYYYSEYSKIDEKFTIDKIREILFREDVYSHLLKEGRYIGGIDNEDSTERYIYYITLNNLF